jgi:hypothetical protein
MNAVQLPEDSLVPSSYDTSLAATSAAGSSPAQVLHSRMEELAFIDVAQASRPFFASSLAFVTQQTGATPPSQFFTPAESALAAIARDQFPKDFAAQSAMFSTAAFVVQQDPATYSNLPQVSPSHVIAVLRGASHVHFLCSCCSGDAHRSQTPKTARGYGEARQSICQAEADAEAAPEAIAAAEEEDARSEVSVLFTASGRSSAVSLRRSAKPCAEGLLLNSTHSVSLKPLLRVQAAGLSGADLAEEMRESTADDVAQISLATGLAAFCNGSIWSASIVLQWNGKNKQARPNSIGGLVCWRWIWFVVPACRIVCNVTAFTTVRLHSSFQEWIIDACGFPCRTMASFFLPVLPATAGSAASAAYTAAYPAPPAASPPLTSKKRKRAPKAKAASSSSAVKWTSEELDLLDELQTEYERLENKPKARWIWTADQWKTRMALDKSGLNTRDADQLKTRAQTNGRKAGGQSARKKQRTGAGSASSAIDEESSDADV